MYDKKSVGAVIASVVMILLAWIYIVGIMTPHAGTNPTPDNVLGKSRTGQISPPPESHQSPAGH